MGIYIKHMEMPECCGYCPFVYKNYCMAKPSLRVEYADHNPRCPLISIPSHGDLIDRDALVRDNGIKEIPEYYEVVRNAPIIISADESDMDSLIHIFEEDEENNEMDSFIRILKD